MLWVPQSGGNRCVYTQLLHNTFQAVYWWRGESSLLAHSLALPVSLLSLWTHFLPRGSFISLSFHFLVVLLTPIISDGDMVDRPVSPWTTGCWTTLCKWSYDGEGTFFWGCTSPLRWACNFTLLRSVGGGGTCVWSYLWLSKTCNATFTPIKCDDWQAAWTSPVELLSLALSFYCLALVRLFI